MKIILTLLALLSPITACAFQDSGAGGGSFSGGSVASATQFVSSVTFQQDVQASGSTVTFNATQTINWQTAGPYVNITLTGNITSSTWSNAANRGKYTLELIQDGTGSRTVAWPSNIIWPNQGSAPTLSTGANAHDFIFMIYRNYDNNFHVMSEALNN